MSTNGGRKHVKPTLPPPHTRAALIRAVETGMHPLVLRRETASSLSPQAPFLLESTSPTTGSVRPSDSRGPMVGAAVCAAIGLMFTIVATFAPAWMIQRYES